MSCVEYVSRHYREVDLGHSVGEFHLKPRTDGTGVMRKIKKIESTHGALPQA